MTSEVQWPTRDPNSSHLYADGYVHAVDSDSGAFQRTPTDEAPCLSDLLDATDIASNTRQLLEATIPIGLEQDPSSGNVIATRHCGRTACAGECSLSIDWNLGLQSKKMTHGSSARTGRLEKLASLFRDS